MNRGICMFTAILLISSSAVPARGRAQDAGSPGCTDPREIAEHRRDPTRMVGGTPTAGYHGIRHGGKLTLGPDGTVGWAELPRIEAVYCGSPAHRAGLRSGDVLLTVNGRDAREPRVLAATRPGMTFRIRVRRAREELEFTVVSIPRPPEAR